MSNKTTDNQLNNDYSGYFSEISDAEFFDDLQVLLNREGMLKAEVSNSLGICLAELERILSVMRPKSSPFTIPHKVRVKAKELRLIKEYGKTWYRFHKYY